MITEVILPQLGETMNEGTIVQWLVNEGDVVNRGDVLFQLESDKAVLDAEAPAKGKVLKILHPKGSKVPVLTVVALIGEPGDDVTPYLTGVAVAAAGPAPAQPSVEQAPRAAEAAIEQGRIFAALSARR
ncbi:MAG: biotin/lipoyl-binding protein, partial [Anaerolineae bacterium]|nr:biotin/lipoyl-binding protein [Anaerolineae bacterium]